MRVGVSLIFANQTDWGRHVSGDFSKPPAVSDASVYEDELRIGSLAEPLGFDSLWTIEHHFTPYAMCPDALQLLSFFAGRTSRIDFGTMVVVLPWHDPVRVAEQIALLDNMLGGRKLHIGFGRGAGRVEFDGFRQDMGESRDRFLESLQIIRAGLANERFSHEGTHYRIPDMSIRPRPRSSDLNDRMYMAWGSPTSVPIAAREGLGALFIPQKDWASIAEEVRQYNEIRSASGFAPSRPISAVWAYCAPTEDEARVGAQHMAAYWGTALKHYELADAEHFRTAKGYEHYATVADIVSNADENVVTNAFASTQVWGTPEMCVEKLTNIQRITGAAEVECFFLYGGMPVEKAEASMRLFAREVLPALHEIDVDAVAVATGR